MRTPLIAANWKMNGSRAMAEALSRGIAHHGVEGIEVAICPPYPYLVPVGTVLAGACALGAQDLDINEDGAYTGQVSARMLADCGCRYVIVGHSERRNMYHETDTLVAKKAAKAISAGLMPIICVGETRRERQDAATDAVVIGQLDAVFAEVDICDFANVVIAYEPVWAIGTGLTATPDQAQAVHQRLREHIAKSDTRIAEECRILYGGSMQPANAGKLIAQRDIDGGLIGGASLQVQDFVGICRAAAGA